MGKEITVRQDQSPVSFMNTAIASGMDLDKIEKMLDLQTKWEEKEAKKAFVAAMSEFKANPPKIMKDKKVGFDHKGGGGSTSYSHASLGNVTESINKGLAENGLSASWKTEQIEGIKITCTITHKMGHSESTSLTAPADSSGKKNSIQAIGSTISYLERYTLLALAGIATHDQDDDGNSSEDYFINQDQVKKITDLIKSKGIDVNEVLADMQCETIDTITQEQFKPLMSKLKMPTVSK